MPNVPQVKYKMRNYSRDNGLKYANMNKASKVWGIGARRNAWRITKHVNGKGSTRKAAVVAILWPDTVPAVKIIAKSYKWAHALTTRGYAPKGIVWHHAAATSCTADQIHQWHLGNGWSGIGYHFFVSKEGKVYRGRPESKLGGHTLNASNWLGVCAEGNYASESMPAAQLKALQGLHRYLHRKYDGITDKRHKDMPGNSTACPGAKYPFAKVISVK